MLGGLSWAGFVIFGLAGGRRGYGPSGCRWGGPWGSAPNPPGALPLDPGFFPSAEKGERNRKPGTDSRSGRNLGREVVSGFHNHNCCPHNTLPQQAWGRFGQPWHLARPHAHVPARPLSPTGNGKQALPLKAISNLIESATKEARAFRSTRYLATMVYLIAGRLHFKLPAITQATHTK